MRPEFPAQFESERLCLRCYRPGDGKWYYAMSVKNHDHLMQYESENSAFNISNEEAAEKINPGFWICMGEGVINFHGCL